MTSGANELIVATKNGMAIKFDENDVRPMGRIARASKPSPWRMGIWSSVWPGPEGQPPHRVRQGLRPEKPAFDYRTQSRAGKRRHQLQGERRKRAMWPASR